METTSQTYRTVIECEVDGQLQRFEADVINPVQESLSTQITNHPLVTNDMLADHMIINPTSITLSGKFSLHGAKPTPYSYTNDRLSVIQETFEKIMKNGLFCSIVTLLKNGSTYNVGNIRFTQRKNMILNSISWTKHVNSLDFTFGFTEALTSEVETPYNVDNVRDPNLPALTDPVTLDFTDTYLDWSKIDECVVANMWDCGLVTEGFLQFVATATETISNAFTGTAIATAAIGIGIVAKVVISAALTATASTGVGVLVVAAFLVVAAVSFAIAQLFSWFSREANKKLYKVQTFRLYETDRENQAEYERFTNFVGSIHREIEMLEDKMKVYGISDNVAQECMFYLDNAYYIFCFEKNNTTGGWSLKVKNVNDELVGQSQNLTGLSSISECTLSNTLFKTSQSNVYLMNTKQEELAQNGASKARIEECKKDLRNYSILVTQMNMELFTQTLQDIIKNALEA